MAFPRGDRDENLTIKLSSGRTVGYARYGVASSLRPPIVYFHGYPSTRLEGALRSTELFDAGLQMISIDRPGFGLSSPSPKSIEQRTILDHIDDVQAVVDHLELKQFISWGYSGGAPYACACASRMPDRVLGLGISAGLGPYGIVMSESVWPKLQLINKIVLTAPLKVPWLYECVYALVVNIAVGTQRFQEVPERSSSKTPIPTGKAGTELCEEDPELHNHNLRNLKETIKQPGLRSVTPRS